MTKRTTTPKTPAKTPAKAPSKSSAKPPAKARSTASKAAKNGGREVGGGLPKDDALDAFGLDSGTALAAFAPRAPRPAAPESPAPKTTATGGGEAPRPTSPVPPPAPEPSTLTAPPQTEARAAPPPVPAPTPPSAPAPRPVDVPTTYVTEVGNDPTQCTIMVRRTVRERFRRYQATVNAETGSEPTNAVVVKRAFLHAHKHELWARLREAVRHRQHPVSEADDDPSGLFGEVPARRVDRGGVKHGVQQSFRPSPQELAVYDSYAHTHGFDNRSDFLDAVLDEFLPPLSPTRRPTR
ncbi:hypothetical protein [Streptomyces sp. G45]|uniref:hypothetical protein n=1 Tax=Streptomyces sp. G45 TaxID=3406627 RepID=UPI003C183E37